LRGAFYTSLRIGLYEPVKSAIGADQPDASGARRFLAGTIAGLLAASVGTPVDLLKVRMMAYEGLESRGIGSFAKDIYTESGPKGFYKGLHVMLVRGMVSNAVNMAVYDSCKISIKKSLGLDDGLLLRFTSSFTAGFFMSASMMPLDVTKTRL
jgi:hypothetical protein